MPTAEIITIGTELLLGEIADTNTHYLARQLRDAGIDLYWTSTVGDNEARIADAIQRGLQRSDVVICTGGLGPTVDDVTREGIARALGSELEFREDVWQQIQARFARFGRTPSDNNKRQAYAPTGARSIENAVGSAPGILVERGKGILISMPGVPGEMKYIFKHEVLPYFKQRFGTSAAIVSRVLHTAGVPESQIDEKIADLEKLANPTVGLAAHAGAVDVRLTAKAEDREQADAMLDDLEVEVRTRLGNWVFGGDEMTLGRSILTLLAGRGKTLAVIEKGLEGALVKGLAGEGDALVGEEVLKANLKTPVLVDLTAKYAAQLKADIHLGAELQTRDNKHELEIAVIGLDRPHHLSLSYGGHTDQAPSWAANVILSTLRRLLIGK
ncbi:MAG: competence/damage-inducible protein A [Anaerolineales bacterium]